MMSLIFPILHDRTVRQGSIQFTHIDIDTAVINLTHYNSNTGQIEQ